MKKFTKVFKILFVAVCLSAAALICACTDSGTDTPPSDGSVQKPKVKITFYADTDALEGDTEFTVERGTSCEFKLTLAEGYSLQSLAYSGESSVIGKVGEVTVLMNNVRYDAAVKVNVDTYTSAIYYYLNGGSFNAEVASAPEYYGDVGQSATHLRKNTSIGTDAIHRDGYTQTGWNTAADGSGQHIGLGSRITVKEGESVRLYAEWAKWSDNSLFTYANNATTPHYDNDIILTSYTGANAEALVIPKEIDGKRVTAIADGFADGKRFEKFIMPDSIEYVGDNRSCSIGEIYLFDAVETFVNGGFNDGIKKCYVNAVVTPRLIGKNSNGVFAESMDRLILNYETDKSNLIFFGGCSMTYGLDCTIVEAVYGNDYYITEVGVNGDVYMPFQFDCVISYLKQGDVLIHAPEMASEQAMLIDDGALEDCDWMLFSAIEGNYDLLSLVDFSSMHGVFTALANFNDKRLGLPKTTYENKNPSFNEYGDCIEKREQNLFPVGELTFNTEGIIAYDKDIAMSAYNKLNDYYQRVKNCGVSAYFTYAPFNIEAVIKSGEYATRAWNDYHALMRGLLDGNSVKIISDPYDYIFDSSYFYDTDYHLTSAGAVLRTNRLIADMQENGI